MTNLWRITAPAARDPDLWLGRNIPVTKKNRLTKKTNPSNFEIMHRAARNLSFCVEPKDLQLETEDVFFLFRLSFSMFLFLFLFSNLPRMIDDDDDDNVQVNTFDISSPCSEISELSDGVALAEVLLEM